MLEPNIVTALLQSSITGAGLILAVYGIIIPVFSKIVRYRVTSLINLIKQIREKPASEFLFKEDSIGEAKESLDYIDEIRKLPTYFNKAVIFSFLGYIATTLLCFFWLLDIYKVNINGWISWIFGISTVLFGYVGYKTIKDLIGLVKIKHDNLLKEATEKLDKKPNNRKKKQK